jgi:prepilin-type processing-associated H-X9-DG protein
MARKLRPGVTAIELVVIIVIVVLLVGLALPGIQIAREANRRGQCSSNLRQIGTALLVYQEAHDSFPPSSTWNVEGKAPEDDSPPDVTRPTSKVSANWVMLILPQLNQEELLASFDQSQYISGAANKKARARPLPVMMCPTDSFNRKPFDGTRYGLGSNWARGNYAANAALGFMTPGTADPHGAAFADSPGWQDDLLRGVMGANCAIGLADIHDGASNTILVGEIRSGISSIDARGVWALGGACPSSLWGHGYVGNDNGPNSIHAEAGSGGDGLAQCGDLQNSQPGGKVALAKQGMPCSSTVTTGEGKIVAANNQQTVRSMHAGGGEVLFADGSVRFINSTIQLGQYHHPMTAADLGVWDRLNLSSDMQPVTRAGK